MTLFFRFGGVRNAYKIKKYVSRNAIICFFKINKTCIDLFRIFPRLLTDLLPGKDLVHCASARTKAALSIRQFRLDYSKAFLFKAFGIKGVGKWGLKPPYIFFSPLIEILSSPSSPPFQKFITLVHPTALQR